MFSKALVLSRDGAAVWLVAAGIVMASALVAPTPALADCTISATTVTCSPVGGPQTTTVGTGAESNYTVNVLSGASVAVGPNGIGIFLNGQNRVTNDGTISAGDASASFSGGIFFS